MTFQRFYIAFELKYSDEIGGAMQHVNHGEALAVGPPEIQCR